MHDRKHHPGFLGQNAGAAQMVFVKLKKLNRNPKHPELSATAELSTMWKEVLACKFPHPAENWDVLNFILCELNLDAFQWWIGCQFL